MSCKNNKNCFNKRCGGWVYLLGAWVPEITACRLGLNRSASKKSAKGTSLNPLGTHFYGGTTIVLSNYFDDSRSVMSYVRNTGRKLIVPYGYNHAVYIDSSGNITEENVSVGQVLTFKSNIILGSFPTEFWACDPVNGCVKITPIINGGGFSSKQSCLAQCCQEKNGGWSPKSVSCDDNCASYDEICSRDCGKIPCGQGKCCEPEQSCCTDSDGNKICMPPDEGECCSGAIGWCFKQFGKCCGDQCCEKFCIQGTFDHCCCDKETDQCINGNCCSAEQVCGTTLPYCCSGADICLDNSCCPKDRVCAGKCCPEGESCMDGKCCPNGQLCNGKCCPDGESCCGVDTCCPSGKCCNGVCCSESETCVNGSCCPSERACNNINCCPEGESCCGGQFDSVCCPAKRTCCDGTCCPEGDSCVDGVCRPYPNLFAKPELISW